MKKSRLFLTVCTLVFALLLSACGSNETGGDNGNGAQKKETFIFARGGDAVSLDPSEVTDSESENVSQSILETLVTFAEGETKVEPLLAKEWKESEDGLTYTFKLREGVKFHDGTDFNAEAVVYNFERWMEPQDKERFYMYGAVFGGFKGDEGHAIKSVEAVDDYTVKFTLNNVQPTFLKGLALTPFSISSPAAIEKYGEDYGSNPVGTGPFTFKEWRRNDRVVLNKNKDYWLDGYPKVDQVIFRTIPENSARLNALLSGEVDMVDGLDPVNIPQVEKNPDLQILRRPSLNLGYLGFNVTREPFDNKLVRQALNHAVDKEKMIDAFFGGQADPAKNPIPPSVEGYNDDIEAYPYDLEKAKALLEEAGYGDGFEMELWAMPVARPYMPNANKVAEYLQSSFAEIGVKAKIVSYEWATYLDKVKQGEADSFLLGWTGTNGDADDFIYTLWHEDNIGSMNSTFYANEELNGILEEARSISDQEKRSELYKRAQEIMHEDPPIIPLVHSTPVLAARSDIKGFDPHPTGRVITTKIAFE
ncbi:ABC transporter substrate-binding protein [Pseudalkalibacillus caeni]|uniref:ABC transporter substrate-binding protein n=1 Tax=Exobacillus caeni TaxID=2574798 RepID=A0A5R9F8T9_9BACL|nr:ABC transporter substrate-binding protein [Pseudalkalibacillus caeni]TLS38670.1 ABC transporter substrate-binding protein [Pseudalkalibacillus caeni]